MSHTFPHSRLLCRVMPQTLKLGSTKAPLSLKSRWTHHLARMIKLFLFCHPDPAHGRLCPPGTGYHQPRLFGPERGPGSSINEKGGHASDQAGSWGVTELCSITARLQSGFFGGGAVGGISFFSFKYFNYFLLHPPKGTGYSGRLSHLAPSKIEHIHLRTVLGDVFGSLEISSNDIAS